ncbi:hypothetical protein [Novosphingobium sp. Rr 2-17]|uniref:hypothetical protein n=1 Tax=Novosphingobium sp. Rr 2-17 TaxID=555793 RepID=UPI0012F63298|nr:hypothetical protein [Novosphingobium sp. Rr 2-17]
MRVKQTLAALAIGASCMLAAPALGQKPPLAMLDELEHGDWELRERGVPGPARSICLDNGRKLIQLRHPGLACSSVIVDDKANDVTVQYTCKGQGYGRTHVRRETNALIQIESQGIVDGLPFSYVAEGRRAGACRG